MLRPLLVVLLSFSPYQLVVHPEVAPVPTPVIAQGVSLEFVERPTRPDYDNEILAPLYEAQAEQKAREEAQAREEAARAAEEARLAQEAARRAEALRTAQNVPTRPVAVSGTCSSWMAAAGITDTANAYTLIMKESGCNPNAVNRSSGACGIGQQLPCGKWPHVWNEPIGAMIDMQAYVFGRYGSWANALAFHYSHNWY